jgi:hypothetical protein
MRSANLAKGLSSPLLCAPARRPARLFGCSTSPRLAACLAACVGAPLDSLSLCTPSACTSGAGVWCAYSGHLPLEAPTSSRTGNAPQHVVCASRNFPAPRFGNSIIPSQSSTVWRRAAAVVFGSPLACLFGQRTPSLAAAAPPPPPLRRLHNGALCAPCGIRQGA